MGKRRSLVITACAALLLGGCGGSMGADEQSARDAIYVEQAQEVAPGVTEENLMKMRARLCELLDASPTREAYLLATVGALKSGMTPEQVGTINAAAVMSGCPQHEAVVTG